MLLTKRQDADMRALAKEAGIRGGGSQDCVQGMLPDEAALEKATETIGRTTPNRIQ